MPVKYKYIDFFNKNIFLHPRDVKYGAHWETVAVSRPEGTDIFGNFDVVQNTMGSMLIIYKPEIENKKGRPKKDSVLIKINFLDSGIIKKDGI